MELPILLSEREREILVNILEGLSYKEIASKLAISEYTVRAHRRSILGKTGCHNCTQLYNYSLDNELLQAV